MLNVSLTGPRRLAALPLMLILSACVTTTGSGGTETYCKVVEPIGWSVEDTDETIAQVKSHNAVWVELCGKKR